jgi:tryptophan 2,3-dioxygenase
MSLLQQVNRWLERMPFFDNEYWTNFGDEAAQDELHVYWANYRALYATGLTEREQDKLAQFDFVFFEKDKDQYPPAEQDTLRSYLSPAAMRAALFILLYRDFPVF